MFFFEVGESEKIIAKIFRVARLHAPCILFFDEIDAIFGKRGDKTNWDQSVIRIPQYFFYFLESLLFFCEIIIVLD